MSVGTNLDFVVFLFLIVLMTTTIALAAAPKGLVGHWHLAFTLLRCVMPFELAGVLHGSELTRCSCQFWHNSRVISSGTLVGQEKYTCGLTAGSL